MHTLWLGQTHCSRTCSLHDKAAMETGWVWVCHMSKPHVNITHKRHEMFLDIQTAVASELWHSPWHLQHACQVLRACCKLPLCLEKLPTTWV